MTLGVGVVGVGGNSGLKLHCAPLARHQQAQLVAVCDQSPERARLASDQFDVRSYQNYEDFLADERVDVVTIATPPFLHATMAIQALRAGKHVVVEKPMCLSVAEADAMIAAACEHRRHLTVFQNRRWDADYLAVRQLLQQNEIGRPWVIESRLQSGPAYGAAEYRASWFQESHYGGGWLLGWGSHLFDQILQLVSSPAATVFAIARSTVWSQDADDYFKTLITFRNGVVAEVEAVMNDRIGLPRWYIRGDRGSLRKQTIGRDSPIEISQLVPGTTHGEFTGATKFIDIGAFQQPDRSASDLFYSSLAASILDGKDLVVRPEEARQTMEVIEASFRSQQRGESVSIENGQ